MNWCPYANMLYSVSGLKEHNYLFCGMPIEEWYHVSILFSMFVMVKGATKERAFEVGNEIVAAVSKVNPKPVKLKLEKVIKMFVNFYNYTFCNFCYIW